MTQLALLGRDMLPEVPTLSPWCLRSEIGHRQKWQLARPGEEFDASNYTVERINRTVAADFVIPRHYAGSHVVCWQSFGLYRAHKLVGVASYCVTSKKALTHAFPELKPGDEALELGRLVVADPEPGNTETWFLARCEEMLLASGVHAVLSFADPVPRIDADGVARFKSHVGFVYQGGNFFIAGRSARRTLWLLPNGAVLNGITMQKIRKQDAGHEAAEKSLISFGATPIRAGQDPAAWLREVRDDPAVGIRLLRHGGCHRYVKPLGRTKRNRKQIKINRRLRPDWAKLDKNAPLPFGPYPKQPDALTLAA
ncbi:hypothetical protein [Micromonospora sp. NPDC051141]|uniref:Mom family adenine methylcarbamoylation protein n=1 Tax=Micromonospora sp. NPDC051141 TaxID=3364284 RepID=UPI00379B3713